MTTSTFRRALRLGLSALLLSLLTVLGLAAPAQAHDRLLESNPVTNATLNESPKKISLTFSAAVESLGSSVKLVDSDGDAASVGSLEGKGATVTADVKEELSAGDYEIRWRVVSSDGHAISGVTPFTVEGTTSSTSASESASGDAAPTAQESTATSQPAEAADTREQSEGGSSTTMIALGAAGIATALGLLLALVWSRGRARER